MPGFSAHRLPRGPCLGRVPGPAPELVAKQQAASMPGRLPCRKPGSAWCQLAHSVFALAPSTPAAFTLTQVPGLSKQGRQCFWCYFWLQSSVHLLRPPPPLFGPSSPVLFRWPGLFVAKLGHRTRPLCLWLEHTLL